MAERQRPKHNRQRRQPGGARRARLNANSRQAAAHQPKRSKGLVQPTHMFLLDKAPGARDPPAQSKTARTSPALPTCEPRAFFSEAGGRDNVPKTRPTSTGPRARSAPKQPRPEGPEPQKRGSAGAQPQPPGAAHAHQHGPSTAHTRAAAAGGNPPYLTYRARGRAERTPLLAPRALSRRGGTAWAQKMMAR